MPGVEGLRRTPSAPAGHYLRGKVRPLRGRNTVNYYELWSRFAPDVDPVRVLDMSTVKLLQHIAAVREDLVLGTSMSSLEIAMQLVTCASCMLGHKYS